MKNYTLYFEFFGRKMKTTVSAESCQEAKDQVADRLNFMSIYENAEREEQSAKHEDPAVKKIFDLFKRRI